MNNMAKFKVVKLMLRAKNIDASPEIMTDYKNSKSFVSGIGSLVLCVDAELKTENCDVSLSEISAKIQNILDGIEI